MTPNRSSRFWRWCVVGQISLGLALLAWLALGTHKVEAFSKPPSEAQFRRFEELRTADVLICQYRTSAIKYEGQDQDEVRISIIRGAEENPNSEEETTDVGIMFDKERTKALYFHPNPPSEDFDIVGIEPWASNVSLLPPRGSSLFGSSMNGAIVLPAVALDPFDIEGASEIVRILANPAYENVFPFIGGTFVGVENAWLVAGQCKPGFPDTKPWPRTVWLRDANCGHSSAQLNIATDQLLRSKTGEGDIVEAYKWLQIYMSAFDDDSFAYYITDPQRDIAASWMSAEQIAEGQRLADEWVADPAQCEGSRLIKLIE